ncbi:flagellin [Piscinibacter koreensis]|uniref:Flagellin n=1 Tax=Piscinibacter koreensis TaxID=2742824 RepID=A0A7Y6NJC2_9BURK|nr:flagellin [Schlegelella koreensis]NUZ04238.1 flagellin [Schlegelella koreensis]
MPSILNANPASLGARLSTERTQATLAASIERLSTGLRINGAKDDAAGLAIAERLTAQARGIGQAARNANDAISLLQTADGALASVSGNLQRVRELAVQAANGTHSSTDRAALQREVAELVGEIDRVATQTTFNGTRILDGSFAGQSFQIGANAKETIAVQGLANLRAGALGTYEGLALKNQAVGPAGNPAQSLYVYAENVLLHAGPREYDAKAVAASVNTLGVRGLAVTANATTVAAGVSSSGASAAGTATFTINGVPIALAGSADAAGLSANRSGAVAAINAASTATGVTASDTGSGISLSAADGRNIVTGYVPGSFTGSSVADFGLAATGSTAGTINIDYEAPTASPGWLGVLHLGGGVWMIPMTSSTGTPLSKVDVSTVDGANDALASIDRALRKVDASRAALGAAQNRFESTVRSLGTAEQNLVASRGRVQDADFALETANLSRAQVLQAAGTAMLTQANQLPQQVLQLLR